TTPDGARTSSWLFGDCDHDGCPNGRDPSPCAAGRDDECGTVTLGDGECVAPVPPRELDAGVPERDAGTVEGDAGGDEQDAGDDELDAGSDELDAGTSGEADAGPETPPGIGFNGGGGCRCAVPGGTSERSGGALLALALVLGAIVTRRRAR